MACMSDFVRQLRAMQMDEVREIKLCYPGGYMLFEMTRLPCQYEEGPILMDPDFTFELRKLNVNQHMWKIGLMGRRRDGMFYKSPDKSHWFMAMRIG